MGGFIDGNTIKVFAEQFPQLHVSSPLSAGKQPAPLSPVEQAAWQEKRYGPLHSAPRTSSKRKFTFTGKGWASEGSTPKKARKEGKDWKKYPVVLVGKANVVSPRKKGPAEFR